MLKQNIIYILTQNSKLKGENESIFCNIYAYIIFK